MKEGGASTAFLSSILEVINKEPILYGMYNTVFCGILTFYSTSPLEAILHELIQAEASSIKPPGYSSGQWKSAEHK